MTNDPDLVPIAPATMKRTTLSTEDYLKRNSEAICNETLNNRNFASPWLDYLAPDVVAIHETTPAVYGKDQLVENLRHMMEMMPDYHAKIVNTTVTVNEQKRTATVHLHLFLTGMPDGLHRESVNVLTWQQREGQWLLTCHSGMRGPISDGVPLCGS
jgi:ketosteroid isomerase-like protein